MVDESTDMTSAWLSGLPYRLWRTHQAVRSHVDAAIDGLGVTVTQLGLCVHLDELGHMSASDLARLVRLTPQSVTTALGHLERMDWVKRVPHPVHKRVIWYELTDAGLAGVADGRARVDAVNQRMDALLTADQHDALVEALTTITTSIDGPDLPAGTMWPVPAGTAARHN